MQMWFFSLDATLHIPNMPRRDILPNNLPAEINKRLVNISPRSCAAFIVWSIIPRAGDREGAGSSDGAILFEIAFVADDDERDERIVFDADDLIAEFLELGEG